MIFVLLKILKRKYTAVFEMLIYIYVCVCVCVCNITESDETNRNICITLFNCCCSQVTTLWLRHEKKFVFFLDKFFFYLSYLESFFFTCL